jgi:hypothetical protein
MNRFAETNVPIMRYDCPQCGGMLMRNDFQFKQFLLDIFEHAHECCVTAEMIGEPLKRERGN